MPGVMDGIEEIEGIGGGPIGEELIAGGGPRLSGDRPEPSGGGIGAERTEQIGPDTMDDRPIGAAGLGNC